MKLFINFWIFVFLFTFSSVVFSGNFDVYKYEPKNSRVFCSSMLRQLTQGVSHPLRFKNYEFSFTDEGQEVRNFKSFAEQVKGKTILISFYENSAKTFDLLGKPKTRLNKVKVATIKGTFREFREVKIESQSEKRYFIDIGAGTNGKVFVDSAKGQDHLEQIGVFNLLESRANQIFSYPISNFVWRWTKIEMNVLE